jgi:menaquinone-9 beta-reductase
VRRVEALVVGGGPAGSAAAIMLARGGAAVELVERSSGPRDVVCGGFLGWDALAALERLGVPAAGLGARPIRRLVLAGRRKTVAARLPFPAAGLSRRRLDEALLAAVGAAGVTVRRGVAARSAAAGRVRLDDEDVAADALFLATGKHELRGLARPLARRAAGAVGLRAPLRPPPWLAEQLDGAIELHPFDGGYAGLLMQEDGAANLCLSVSAARLKEAGGVQALLLELAGEAPLLGERLALAEPEQWSSIGNVPYGWRARSGEPGLYRIGDQGAVIASLAGDGVAIALTSGMAAGAAYGAQQDARLFQKSWAARAARPLAAASGLRWAAERAGPRRALVGLARLPGAAAAAARLTRIA